MKHVLCLTVLMVFLYTGFLREHVYAQQRQQEEAAFSEEIEVITSSVPSGDHYETRGLLWLALLLLGILLYQGLHVYKYLHPHGMLSSHQSHQLQAAQLELIEQIAQLDRQFANGDIEEDWYRTTRNQQKQILIDVTLLCRTSKYEEA